MQSASLLPLKHASVHDVNEIEPSQKILKEADCTFFQTRCVATTLQKSHQAPTDSTHAVVSLAEEAVGRVPAWNSHVFRWPLCPGSQPSAEYLFSLCAREKIYPAFYRPGDETQM